VQTVFFHFKLNRFYRSQVTNHHY